MDIRSSRLSLVMKGTLAVAALALSSSVASAAGDVAAGAAIFKSHCVVCHKADASGGIHFGATESADLRAPELEKQYKETDALIMRAMLDGKDEDGKDLAKIMPRWRGRLTDAQAANVIAFLKTEIKD
ncbi:cytochrome c6 [mine drainage metagenome]|uniref:Cytochrome c6 n=1 Tax=mine drainage metagenome TaxID=410659 RepID=A0A1J5PG36_9ZZZZ